MDDVSRGIATAAFTLLSVMLQALVSKGVLTTDEALEVVDKSLDAVVGTPDEEEVDEIAEVAHALPGARAATRAGRSADPPMIDDPDIFRAASC
jgi:hypothetical protein